LPSQPQTSELAALPLTGSKMDGEKGLGLGMAAGGSKTVKSKNQSQLAARDQWMQ